MRLTPTERDRLLLFTAAELARARKATRPAAQRPRGHGASSRHRHRGGPRRQPAPRRRRRSVATCSSPTTSCPGSRPWSPRSGSKPSSTTAAGSWSSPSLSVAAHWRLHARVACTLPDEQVDAATPATLELTVANTSDVPISVTSHFHFFEVNPRLEFDRGAAYGMRLAIDAGEAIRFDPQAVGHRRARPDRW